MKRRAKGRWLNVLGVVVATASIAGLVALFAATYALRPPPTDPDTLCRLDAPLSGHTVILVDVSDEFAPRHAKRLHAVVASERARLPQYDRLTLLVLRPEAPREPRVLFSKCNPGDGSRANPLWSNPARIQARFEEAFGAPLREAAEKAARGRGGRESPLTTALTAAATDPDFGPEIPARRLVFASDLLEHRTGVFSLYADGASLVGFRKTELAGQRLPDLSAITLRMVVLDRPDFEPRQAAARVSFWEPWLEDAGARSVSWEP